MYISSTFIGHTSLESKLYICNAITLLHYVLYIYLGNIALKFKAALAFAPEKAIGYSSNLSGKTDQFLCATPLQSSHPFVNLYKILEGKNFFFRKVLPTEQRCDVRYNPD